MRSRPRLIPYGDHIAVVVGYAVCFTILSHFSQAYWTLTTALRAACLLLVPRKYWASLAIGDVFGLFRAAIDCATWGGLFVASSAFPVILPCMPLVSALLKRMPSRYPTGKWRIPTVLMVAAIIAVVSTARSDIVLLMAYLSRPDGVNNWLTNVRDDSALYLVGTYIGTLTLLPLVLALDESTCRRVRVDWRPVVHDAVLLAAPYLAVIVSMARADTFADRIFAQVAIALPVICLTANHGMRGAAIGGMLSSIALHGMLPSCSDLSNCLSAAMLAFVMTCALLSTRPSRPVRTFEAYPRIRVGLDRASFYFERGISCLLARPRQSRNPSKLSRDRLAPGASSV